MSQVLSKGANAPLRSTDLRVDVASSTPLDIAAILVTPRGKVRSDDDFVFFNQPTGPGVRLLPPSGLAVTLSAVPPDIDKVVVTGSVDPATGLANFVGVRSLAVSVQDTRGAELVSFEPADLGIETAALLVEFYRRQGAWKVRAVGQGYASGLAGLATDFGIDVSDPGPSAPDDQPTQVVRPPSSPPPPLPPPSPRRPSQPQPPAPQPPAPAPAAPPPPAASPGGRNNGVLRRGLAKANRRPGTDRTHHRRTQPAAARFDTSRPNLNLNRGRVSLHQGQTVSLVRSAGPPPNMVRIGMGWAVVDAAEDTYLDASCILYDERGNDVDKVWFMSKKAVRGAVRHGGDSTGRRRDGGEEFVHVDFAGLPLQVRTLIFTVNSFGGQRFAGVRSVFCRLVDDRSGAELVRFDLPEIQPQTGLVMCRLQRDSAAPHTWTMTAIGEFHDGKTVRAMVGPAKQYL